MTKHLSRSRSRSRRRRSRKNPMKGWAKSAPKHGRQRSAMKIRCGNKCFLRPGNNGFPVCAKNSCSYSCKGLLAAKTRARQYKYTSIAQKAQALAVKQGCGWTRRSRSSGRFRFKKRSKSRRKSRRRFRYHKGSRSRTRRGRQDFITHEGSIVYNPHGIYVWKSPKPYTKRRRRSHK